MSQSIKIYYTDFWSNFDKFNNPLINALKLNYNVELSQNNPDLLFFSVFGTDYKEFKCKRIFFTGENVRPDYKKCDYSFTFDYINDKRNYRLPLYPFFNDVNLLLEPKDPYRILSEKSKFCNFIYSNPTQKVRNQFFKNLSKYKKVDSAGRYLNNVGKPVGNKLEFITDYKFTIAFENSSYPGYTTEKIFEPMLVNSLPIYWGNPYISRDFNTKSFLNYFDFPDEKKLIDKIVELDENDSLYAEYMSQPYFIDNKLNEFIDPKNILNQLKMIIESDIIPVGTSSKVFSQNKLVSKIEKTKIESKFKLAHLISKIISFRFYKLKIKYNKLIGKY